MLQHLTGWRRHHRHITHPVPPLRFCLFEFLLLTTHRWNQLWPSASCFRWGTWDSVRGFGGTWYSSCPLLLVPSLVRWWCLDCHFTKTSFSPVFLFPRKQKPHPLPYCCESTETVSNFPWTCSNMEDVTEVKASTAEQSWKTLWLFRCFTQRRMWYLQGDTNTTRKTYSQIIINSITLV